MNKKLKSVALGTVVFAAILGLMIPAHAINIVPGWVYYPDGTPAEGVEVTVTNLNTGNSYEDITDATGFYIGDPSSPHSIGDPIKIVATKDGFYATKTVPLSGPAPMVVNLTLQAAAPTLTPIGLIALIGLLSAIAAITRVRKRQ